MTLQEFLTLNGGNDYITVIEEPGEKNKVNYYCEEENQKEIVTSDIYKEISDRTIKEWVIIGGGVEKVEIYITLNKCQESDTGESEGQKAAKQKHEMAKELDETIISICREIKCTEERCCGCGTDAELVKALADLVEVRSCLPDYKFGRN